jgi:nicotinamidase-related amidase
MQYQELPIPAHFNPAKVGEVWKVPYEERAGEAREWADEHDIQPSTGDDFRIGLMLIDVQNTFCLPDFELFVAGRSGTGAVDDNRRLCQFIYRNLGAITEITATLDTHAPMQIFHATFLVDEEGEHPDPMTLVSAQDIQSGRWKFNPALVDTLGITSDYGQQHIEHYVEELQAREKYDLTIWPYHAILGGIGHALVSAVEETLFFHSITRYSPVDFVVKGDNPLTEHYSAVGPEVLTDPKGEKIAQKSSKFVEKLAEYDLAIITGQAKSHCLAWTISDLLEDIRTRDESLVRKVYLLEDTTSAVVVPGVVDYTEEADAAFQRFAEAGMHVVSSSDPIATWPGVMP